MCARAKKQIKDCIRDFAFNSTTHLSSYSDNSLYKDYAASSAVSGVALFGDLRAALGFCPPHRPKKLKMGLVTTKAESLVGGWPCCKGHTAI